MSLEEKGNEAESWEMNRRIETVIAGPREEAQLVKMQRGSKIGREGGALRQIAQAGKAIDILGAGMTTRREKDSLGNGKSPLKRITGFKLRGPSKTIPSAACGLIRS